MRSPGDKNPSPQRKEIDASTASVIRVQRVILEERQYLQNFYENLKQSILKTDRAET